jgi:hypothetical protein
VPFVGAATLTPTFLHSHLHLTWQHLHHSFFFFFKFKKRHWTKKKAEKKYRNGEDDRKAGAHQPETMHTGRGRHRKPLLEPERPALFPETRPHAGKPSVPLTGNRPLSPADPAFPSPPLSPETHPHARA